jgi:hypothetical protein
VFIGIIAPLAVVLSFITALLGLVAARRAKATAATVQQITVSVDGQMSGMILRIDQLLEAMHSEGVAVPPAPSPAEVAEAVKTKNGVIEHG